LSWNNGTASGESTERRLGGRNEMGIGLAGDDAPVGAYQWLMQLIRYDSIYRTAVYVTRSHGGVGGGEPFLG
jgi:hypothetical protein